MIAYFNFVAYHQTLVLGKGISEMLNLLRDHVSFNSNLEISQICKPIFDAFKFNHFTYARIFPDGSRAILTTSSESLYDL